MRRLGTIKIWGLAALLASEQRPCQRRSRTIVATLCPGDGVDYAGWQARADREKLDQVVRWLGELPADVSPTSEGALNQPVQCGHAASAKPLPHRLRAQYRTPNFHIFKRTFIRWQGASLSLDQIEKALAEKLPRPTYPLCDQLCQQKLPSLRKTLSTPPGLTTGCADRLFAHSQDAVNRPANNSSAFSGYSNGIRWLPPIIGSLFQLSHRFTAGTPRLRLDCHDWSSMSAASSRPPKALTQRFYACSASSNATAWLHTMARWPAEKGPAISEGGSTALKGGTT